MLTLNLFFLISEGANIMITKSYTASGGDGQTKVMITKGTVQYYASRYIIVGVMAEWSVPSD